MAYTAVDLSKYLVTKCIQDENPITNLQLQKILYHIQKAFLKRGDIAFYDEIEAWQLGPVVPSVYYFFCSYGGMPITLPYKGYSITSKDEDVISPILTEKREMEPWDLVEDTHKIGGAWWTLYDEGRGRGKVIPASMILKEGSAKWPMYLMLQNIFFQKSER